MSTGNQRSDRKLPILHNSEENEKNQTSLVTFTNIGCLKSPLLLISWFLVPLHLFLGPMLCTETEILGCVYAKFERKRQHLTSSEPLKCTYPMSLYNFGREVSLLWVVISPNRLGSINSPID